MANYPRWDDVKKQHPHLTPMTGAGIERTSLWGS